MANLAAFIHGPKGHLSDVYFHPIHTKDLWDKVWAEARKQDWWPDDEKSISCVGNRDGYFYFQITGLATGFARIKIDERTMTVAAIKDNALNPSETTAEKQLRSAAAMEKHLITFEQFQASKPIVQILAKNYRMHVGKGNRFRLLGTSILMPSTSKLSNHIGRKLPASKANGIC